LKPDFLSLYLPTPSETRWVFPLGLSKQLALAALFLLAEKGYQEREAVKLAGERFGQFPGMNVRTLKKCASEAQALVAFICSAGLWSAVAGIVWTGIAAG
jgi:hypothetical protein